MSEHMKYQGLCTTCNHAPSCVRMNNINMPVLYCEEFDDYQPSREKSFKGFAEYGPAEIAEISKLSASREMGLCAFCDNQGNCAISKSEGGVWHCEEYRQDLSG